MQCNQEKTINLLLLPFYNLVRKAVFFVHQSKMFPIDHALRSYIRQNFDIFLVYFSLGFLLQLPVTVMRFFFVDELHFRSADLAQAAAVVGFPWAVKPLTAFLSDNFFRKCLRRSRQVSLGYGLSGLSWFALFLFPRTTFLVLLCAFLSSYFMSLADVCQDGIMVRRINTDSSNANGRLQSFVLATRAFGSLLGSFFSGALALVGEPFLIIGLLHLIGIWSGWKLQERRGDGRVHKSTCVHSCSALTSAMLWPERLLFIGTLFLLAMPLSDFAIMQYWFQKTKHVSTFSFAMADAVAYIATITSSLFFNMKLRNRDWRVVVMLTQCILFVFLACNILLLNNYLNWNPTVYFFIRAGIGSFFGHLGFMPLAVKSADLVADGMESTFYSLYMSTMNFGSVCSEELSGLTTKVIGVDASTDRSVFFYMVVIASNLVSLLVFHIVYSKSER